MTPFFKDIVNNQLISWEELIDDLNITKSYNPYCLSNDYYQVFRQIIQSMILEKEIVLLDSDFTETERLRLTGFSSFENFESELPEPQAEPFENKVGLIARLKETGNSWKITLFTSGTTGLPKKVSHSFASITRFVKLSKKNENSVWGFAYNPTHMAGLQVFLQALLNGNTLVRLFGLDNKSIYQEIGDNRISHISATPTFYRMLLPGEGSFESVQRITSGGEKFSESTVQQLEKVFPKAKITNVFASTEAGTLFASENDIFTIKEDFRNLVKIENRELLIHQSLMGAADFATGEWYNTSDLVEIVESNPLSFRFVSRKSEMINVGGYKVNPGEVEETIRSVEGIKNAKVSSKSNSVLGNILICEVVAEDKAITESYLRQHLQLKLQEFKIPRIIKFKDELETTRTGKIKRN